MQQMTAFEHTHPATNIMSGPGRLAELPEILEARAVSRVLAVCGRTVATGPQMQRLREILGDRLVAVFDGVRPHAGIRNLEQGAALVREHAADALLSLGGGATMDSAKCMAMLLAREGAIEDYLVTRGTYSARARRRLPRDTILHVAVPTTAGSSSEVMPWAGIRDEATRHKLLFRDPALVPDVALLDPEVLVFTNPELTASSGMTAVARSVEVLYSRDRQPLAEAYALQALGMMRGALPRAVAEGTDLAARSATQLAALMSGIAADNSMVSVVHAVGHAVGGRFALQHGVAHALLLPPAAERYLPSTGSLQIRAAEALGERPTSEEQACAVVVHHLRRLLGSLPLPQRLRDVGVGHEDISDLADLAVADPMAAFAPRPLVRDEVAALLEEVW